jgi:anti-sigma B factor antagonist
VDAVPTSERSLSGAVVILTEETVADGMAELRWELRDLVLAGVRNVTVDVAKIDRLSSTTLAALLGTHRVCRARGGGVIIRNPNHRAVDLLRRTGLHRVFVVDPPLQ